MLGLLTLDTVALPALWAIKSGAFLERDDDGTAGRRAPVNRLVLLHGEVQRPIVVFIEHVFRNELFYV